MVGASGRGAAVAVIEVPSPTTSAMSDAQTMRLRLILTMNDPFASTWADNFQTFEQLRCDS
jgi:hypothetical protein